MQIISRKDAKVSGLKYYFTGEPCKHGHISTRLTGKGSCTECNRLYQAKRYAEEHDKMLAFAKSYRDKNKEKVNAKYREWMKNNPDKYAESQRKHRENNPDKVRLKHKRYREANKEKVKQWNKDWSANNRGRINEYRNERYASDPIVKLSKSCRDSVHRLLSHTGYKKSDKTIELLGYTVKQLKDHLESKFEEGMSWDNHGEWHIDHITPLTVMVEMGITDPAVVNGLDNLQPLWASDNLSKGNRYVG